MNRLFLGVLVELFERHPCEVVRFIAHHELLRFRGAEQEAGVEVEVFGFVAAGGDGVDIEVENLRVDRGEGVDAALFLRFAGGCLEDIGLAVNDR